MGHLAWSGEGGQAEKWGHVAGGVLGGAQGGVLGAYFCLFHMGGDERDLAPCAFRLPRIWSQQKQQQWDSTLRLD